jgi:hypothetical protein
MKTLVVTLDDDEFAALRGAFDLMEDVNEHLTKAQASAGRKVNAARRAAAPADGVTLRQPVLVRLGLTGDGKENWLPGVFLGIHSLTHASGDLNVNVWLGPPASGTNPGHKVTVRRSQVRPLCQETDPS